MKTTEFLKYEFDEEELRIFSRDLARESTKLTEAEEEKKAVVAQFAERCAVSKSTISRLARYINNGYEYRNIDCEVHMHTPSDGIKTIARIDNGQIVKQIAMTAGELQENLFEQHEESNTAN